MKEFDLSDKELKSLLQSEGMEEPSMGFNQAVLSKIDASEKHKIEPVRAPKWLIVSLLVLFIAPALYSLGISNINLTSFTEGYTLPSISLNLGLNNTFSWIILFAIAVVWIALIFDKYLSRTRHSSS